jgi:DNA-binding MurR/RpiR family transcriptional regulator
LAKNTEQTLLRITEVAGSLSLSRRSVADFIRSGALEAINLTPDAGRGQVRVSEAALARFIEARRVKPSARRVKP